mmetsp:Transcript_46019/g.90706  ORF Transcript_46019/g.90706 Transcript_46019/m.90706 type:complete len:440 (+) Transcript_46019:36-1355(+)
MSAKRPLEDGADDQVEKKLKEAEPEAEAAAEAAPVATESEAGATTVEATETASETPASETPVVAPEAAASETAAAETGAVEAVAAVGPAAPPDTTAAIDYQAAAAAAMVSAAPVPAPEPEVEQPVPEGYYAGTVRWFLNQKGYGFLIKDGFQIGQDDVFVHQSGLVNAPGTKGLMEGERVWFRASNESGKLRASDVTGPNFKTVKGQDDGSGMSYMMQAYGGGADTSGVQQSFVYPEHTVGDLPPGRHRGTCVSFLKDKGYGFIKPADGGPDVFFYNGDLKTQNSFRSLAEGENVEFQYDEFSQKVNAKRKALLITGPGGANCVGVPKPVEGQAAMNPMMMQQMMMQQQQQQQQSAAQPAQAATGAGGAAAGGAGSAEQQWAEYQQQLAMYNQQQAAYQQQAGSQQAGADPNAQQQYTPEQLAQWQQYYQQQAAQQTPQ